MRNNFNHLGMGLHIYFFVSFIYLIEIDFDIDIDTDLDITILLHIYMIYDISHRIHGAGIYANIGGILMGSMLPYIAAPWILWDISYIIYIYTHTISRRLQGHRCRFVFFHRQVSQGPSLRSGGASRLARPPSLREGHGGGVLTLKPWENHRTTIGKPEEKHGTSIKPWEKNMVKTGNHLEF